MPLETVHTGSAEATRGQASDFAAKLSWPSLVLLEGTLGAGKTEWVKGLVGGLGGSTADVSSPTFALAHTYPVSRGTVCHWDLYRLEPGTDWAQLELWEHIADAGTCTVIEWPDRCAGPWPESAWTVRLEVLQGDQRRLCWSRKDSA
jgi:tRNA threonylcarbamoyladenosine biosynthesis protein TsaE